MNTTARPAASDTPLLEFILEEWERTCPRFDLASLVRTGTHALEVAADTSLDIRRREAAREIGVSVSEWLLELIDSARARQEQRLRGLPVVHCRQS